MSGRYCRPRTPHFEPDLPITPMLDMSFQLMAFFLLTFRPMPLEGQMAMALPALPGVREDLTPRPSEIPDPSEDITVTVDATAEGKIKSLTLVDSLGSRKLGVDLKEYQKALQEKSDRAQRANKKVGKLKLEIDKGLIHEYVVQLIDVAIRSGYEEISPEPKKESETPKK